MLHRDDCSRSHPISIGGGVDVQVSIPLVIEDKTEAIASSIGQDGERWSFVGSKSGPMVEVVKLRPDGSVAIAPHASADDLRIAIHVLAHSLYEAQRIQGVVPADISIDVRV